MMKKKKRESVGLISDTCLVLTDLTAFSLLLETRPQTKTLLISLLRDSYPKVY